MTHATASYSDLLAQRIEDQREHLAAHWLDRLMALLPLSPREVFPSNQLLDHIPALVHAIADYLRAPFSEEIAANTSVITKARELGLLRHQQQASVHQLLREYEILGGILENFVAEETERLKLNPPPAACFDVYRRINRAVRALMQTTVDTFVSEYTDTIEQQTNRLESFNRTASHELRTPLSTLHFAVELLGKGDFSSDAKSELRLLDVIRRNSERSLALLRNLERLARAESTPDTPSQQRIEVKAVAQEVSRHLRDMADARDVQIRIGDDLPVLFIDTSKLELILMNLISNAIKYSDPSKPERFVDVSGVQDPDGTCMIRIRDNGLGISEEALPTIFNRFVRLHIDRDQELRNEGTGLGLAIVLEYVRTLNGTIAVESVEGQGTIFKLTLPDSRSDTPAENQTP